MKYAKSSVSAERLYGSLVRITKRRLCCFCTGRGVKVVPVTDEIAKDILEIRLLTEQNSAYLAAARANDQSVKDIFNCLQNLEDQLETRDGIKLYRLDHTFHRAIAKATNNKWLYRETELILDNYLRFENKSVYNNSIDAQTVFNEHLAIAEAIKKKDPDKAKRMIRKHLINSYKRTLNKIFHDEDI